MLSSIKWKCKYCGNRARVAKVMGGRRVRCPACAAFSKVRLVRRSRSQLRGPHSTTMPERESTSEKTSLNRATQGEQGKHDLDTENQTIEDQ